MSRNIERKLVYVVGSWQLVHGLFTILYYSIFQRNTVSTAIYYQFDGMLSAGTIFAVINTFGTLVMGIGLFNLVAARNYMKDNTISKKIGAWLILIGLFSYFIMDMPSLVLAMSAGILYLAKNKSIKVNHRHTNSSSIKKGV